MQIYRSIADVPGDIWDTTVNGELGFDRELLATCELTAESRSVYFVYEHNDGSAIVATAMEFRDSGSSSPFTDLMLGRLNRSVPALRRAFGRMLIFRSQFVHDCGIAPRLDDGKESRDRLNAFLNELEHYAERERIAIAMLSVREADKWLATVFEQRGYAATMSRPIATLHVNWSNWDEYLRAARQKSANAVSSIRREVNRAEKSGLVVSEWDSSITSEQALRKIYDMHHRRWNNAPLRYPQDFFTTLKNRLGDRVNVLVAYRGADLVGSTFILSGNRRGALPLVGIDHNMDAGSYAYFNLVYYSPIRLATERGWELISYGAGAYAAKIRRGCLAEVSRVFWRPSSGTGRRICYRVCAVHEAAYRRKFRFELAADEFSMLGH